MEPSSKKLIFVVDNEQVTARTLALILQRAGCHAAYFYDAEEALAAAALYPPDLIVSDVVMNGMNGIELQEIIAERCPGVPCILISGQARTSELIQRTRDDGRDVQVHAKPIHPATLLTEIERLLSLPSREQSGPAKHDNLIDFPMSLRVSMSLTSRTSLDMHLRP